MATALHDEYEILQGSVRFYGFYKVLRGSFARFCCVGLRPQQNELLQNPAEPGRTP
jgi:hypothetical protein